MAFRVVLVGGVLALGVFIHYNWYPELDARSDLEKEVQSMYIRCLAGEKSQYYNCNDILNVILSIRNKR